MPIRTTVRLADPFGNPLTEIAQYTKLDYVLNCTPGAIGVLELTLPLSFDTSLLMYDGRLSVWRSIDGRPAYHDGQAIYLIQTFEYSANATLVRAYHATQLLERRIIAYSAGSAETDKTGFADDLIKEFWTENAGSGAGAILRDGLSNNADLSAYVSVQADLSQGVSVSKGAARRNLLDTARELAEASTTEGTYLTFEIVAPTESTLELRTYANQRGVDRRVSSGNPVILSEARGNLENAVLSVDYRDIATFVVAGGVGEKENRFVNERPTTPEIDTAFSASPFARVERFIDDSNESSLTVLANEANAALRANRVITTFTGDLIETPATTRGIHFDLGDQVTAEHPRSRQQFDVRIDVIHETIDQSGRRAQITLRSVD